MLSRYIILQLPLIWISCSSTALVKWIPDKRFNLPINFSNQKLPCSKETVVFPDTLEESVKIDGNFSLSEIVLPVDGEIILHSGLIEFGANPDDKNCIQENVFYSSNAVSMWNDADVWNSSRFNKATPDAEKMPCFDDIVEFPNDTEFTISMPPQAPFQWIKELRLSRKRYGSTEITMGQVFNIWPWPVRYSAPCKAVSGCACQEEPIPVNCETKICHKANCVSPIKPVGNCCFICGGELIFEASELFNLMKYKEFVEKTIESYGGSQFAYHVGKLSDGRVQVVVVNEGEYDGSSSEAVNLIGHYLEKHLYRGSLRETVSGSPSSKAGLGGKIAISMFFFVVGAMAGLYVYYYKFPRIRIPILNRYPQETISRFHRRTDSVVTLTRRDSNAGYSETNATAFRNPLYDSKRGRDGVTE